jgi:hypothetical protein
MVGTENDPNIVNFIDFGVSKSFINSDSKHISFKYEQRSGNMRYSSINAHKGYGIINLI